MNQATSAPGASLLPDSIDLLTGAHLAIVAVFALLVIAAMIWGVRLKRRRKAGLRAIAEHNQTVEQRNPPVAPDDANEAETPPRTDGAAPGPPLAPDTDAAQGPVTQLKGLGPKLADRLAELGVTTVGQIAALNDDEAAALDAQLGAFAGRMTRDRWQEQARFLAAGDRAGFEAVFGRL